MRQVCALLALPDNHLPALSHPLPSPHYTLFSLMNPCRSLEAPFVAAEQAAGWYYVSLDVAHGPMHQTSGSDVPCRALPEAHCTIWLV